MKRQALLTALAALSLASYSAGASVTSSKVELTPDMLKDVWNQLGTGADVESAEFKDNSIHHSEFMLSTMTIRDVKVFRVDDTSFKVFYLYNEAPANPEGNTGDFSYTITEYDLKNGKLTKSKLQSGLDQKLGVSSHFDGDTLKIFDANNKAVSFIWNGKKMARKDSQDLTGDWTDGCLTYTANKKGAYFNFVGYTEGEEHNFKIGKSTQDKFIIKDVDFTSFGKKGFKVEHITMNEKSGKNVELLVSFNSKKQVFNAIQKDSSPDTEFYKTAMRQTLAPVLKDNYEVVYDVYASCAKNVFVSMSGKVYAVKFVEDGIDIFNTKLHDSPTMPIPTTLYKSVKYTDSGEGWWPQTSQIVLNSTILKLFDPKQLRIMRNEIYARHGWTFASDDLKAHFSKFPWYKPTGNNSAIKLSDLEQLNVDLLKAAEENGK